MGLVNRTKLRLPCGAFMASPLTDLLARHLPAFREVAGHFARVLPTVVLVPAFGLRALSLPLRMAMALLFALCMYSGSLSALPPTADGIPWPLLLIGEFLAGLPIAIAAAVPLWAAASAGGLAEQLRGGSESMSSPLVEGRTSPLGVLFAMLAALGFLGSGGPSRVLLRLATVPAGDESFLLRISSTLLSGIDISVAFAAPLLGAAVVLDVVSALAARSAAPAHLQQTLSPLRALGILCVLAFALERITRAISAAHV